jgi:hypothetical protein
MVADLDDEDRAIVDSIRTDLTGVEIEHRLSHVTTALVYLKVAREDLGHLPDADLSGLDDLICDAEGARGYYTAALAAE